MKRLCDDVIYDNHTAGELRSVEAGDVIDHCSALRIYARRSLLENFVQSRLFALTAMASYDHGIQNTCIRHLFSGWIPHALRRSGHDLVDELFRHASSAIVFAVA